MSMFVWSEKYSLGIAEVDRQHQKLFALLNELYDAMQQGHGSDVIGKVLDSVIDYTSYHFAYEEKLFRQYGYVEDAVHRSEHVRLAEQAKQLSERLHTQKTDVTMATLKFLCDWLANHVLGSDKKYAAFMIQKGAH